MPKKLFTKLGRLTLLYMAIMGQIVMIAWLVLMPGEVMTTFNLQVLPAIHAAIWHARNGNTVTYDGHRFHVPSSWYPEPDTKTGALDLHYAPFGSLSLDSVHLATGQKLDDVTLQNEFAKSADHLNQRSSTPDEWKVETLQSRALKFRCIATADELTQILNCQASDSNLRVVLLTGRRSRIAALNILETSE